MHFLALSNIRQVPIDPWSVFFGSCHTCSSSDLYSGYCVPSWTSRYWWEVYEGYLVVFFRLVSSKNRILFICGDFNYWVDDLLSKPCSSVFLELEELNTFVKLVSFHTHVFSHTLDLVLCQNDANFVEDMESIPIDSKILDHYMIITSLDLKNHLHFER